MSVSFEQPILLVLLVPSLALVYALWHSSRAYLPPVRRFAALGLRGFAVSLLVVAISGPTLRLHANDLAVAVLLDRSDSITPAQRAQQEAWVAEALAHKSPTDQLALITFAGEASLQRALSTDAAPPVLADDTTLRGARTDIGRAIQLGLSVLPPDAARRIVLISDGNENAGNAQEAASLAQAAGVHLETLTLTGDAGPQALVEAVDAPARLHQGDNFTATVQVRATEAMQASLQLLADDRLVGSQDVQLEAGTNRFVMPVDTLSIGTHVLRLVMQADGDPRPQNKTGGAYVIVDGPPCVLIVEGSPGQGQYLARALQASGLLVDTTRAQDGPFQADTLNNYASVILANVPANQMTQAGADALQNYVQTHGGGLVVSGGDQAYGPGGYARSPLESILPVKADLRGTSLQSSVGLVLAIDTSGSMSESVGGTTIMELAKESAIAAAESLGPTDKIGVISFEDKSSWAIEPTDASQMDAISAAVNQMTPDGGDDTIGNVLSLAYDGIADFPGQNKHVIVLTDGETPGGDYANMIERLRANRISVSTIGIGSQADTQLLQQVAQMGGGAYYDGSDPFNLPELVLKETQQLQRAAIVEKDTQPIATGSSPVLSGIDPQQLPALRGYVATTPKPQSSVILAAASADPLLVEWQYGLGRVVSWTSDASNRWSAGWLAEGQSAFQSLWTQIVKHTIRPPEDPNRQVSVIVSGDQATVTLDALSGAEGSAVYPEARLAARSGQRQYVNFLPSVASVTDPAGVTQQVPLPQVGPGRYRASVPAASDGVYTLQVTERAPDGSQSTQSSGFVVPYSPEYRDLNANDGLMAMLASMTGGRSISTGDEAFAHDLPAVGAPRSIWPQLLALLALVLVADVGVRRLRLTGVELQSGYRSVRKRLGYVDERPTRPVRIIPPTRRVPLAPTNRPLSSHAATPAPTTSMSQQLLAAKRRVAKR